MMPMLTTVEPVVITVLVVGHAIVAYVRDARQARRIAVESAWILKQIPTTAELVIITVLVVGHATMEHARDARWVKRIAMESA